MACDLLWNLCVPVAWVFHGVGWRGLWLWLVVGSDDYILVSSDNWQVFCGVDQKRSWWRYTGYSKKEAEWDSFLLWLGWKEDLRRYWCLSVGFACRSGWIWLLLRCTCTSRNGSDWCKETEYSWVNLMLEWIEFKYSPSCTKLHQVAPILTKLHQSAPSYTKLHEVNQSVPCCTRMH